MSYKHVYKRKISSKSFRMISYFWGWHLNTIKLFAIASRLHIWSISCLFSLQCPLIHYHPFPHPLLFIMQILAQWPKSSNGWWNFPSEDGCLPDMDIWMCCIQANSCILELQALCETMYSIQICIEMYSVCTCGRVCMSLCYKFII